MVSLKIQGKGASRLKSTLSFFTLSGSSGWSGELQIEGTPRSWVIRYEGNYCQAYYDVMTNTGWEEAISLDN